MEKEANNEIKKTNEQLHQEFEDALKTLEEKTYNLLHYGRYQLKNVSRSITTNKVNFAEMQVGKHKISLRTDDGDTWRKGTDINLNFENNPVNDKLLESWDRQTIQNDIEYHQRRLKELTDLKKEMESKNSNTGTGPLSENSNTGTGPLSEN